MRRGLAIILGSVLLVGLVVTPASAWPRARRIANWEPEFMARGHSYTRTEALAHAREFDVIIAIKGAFREHVGAMKQVNPKLRLLVYQNGGYSLPSRSYPESWYAHSAGGARIRSRDYGNYLMQISNASWRGEVVQTCREHLRFSRYDGCFLDSVGPAALSTDYVTGLPVDPSTREVWTLADYVRAGASLARAVENHVGRHPVVANGVASGRAYFTSPGSTGALVDPIDGGMVELFVRTPFSSATSFRSMSDWRLDVDMLVHAGGHGRRLFCVTKAWSSATMQTKHTMFRYALATFLLGTNGRSYFSFLYDRDTARSSTAWDAKLGRPTARYVKKDGVFQRRFRHGRVLVNASDRGVRVRLAKVFITPDGKRVRRVWMPGHTGMILRRP